MNNVKLYACLVFSAWLYAIPALCNTYFWWVSFLFLLPFLYVAVQQKISYTQAYVWSFFANGFHLAGVLIGIAHMAEGPLWQATIVAFFGVVYAALFGLSIVCIARVCSTYIISHGKTNIIWSYVAGFWVYFLLMDHVCMTPFDVVEGYFLLHPVLPLVRYPELVRLLPWLHGEGLCMILLGTQAALFGLLYERSLYWKKLSTGFFLFWVLCVVIPVQKMVQPVWFSKVVAVPYIFRSKPSVENMIDVAAALFKDVAEKHKNATVFIMPEASFYYDQLGNNEIVHALTKKHLDRSIHVLTGSFAWEDKKYRNTLYWLYEGALQAQFHKTHAMMLTERTPSWFRYSVIHELYFKNVNEIIPSQNVRPTLAVTHDFHVVPYICSELFFAKRPRDCFGNCTVYALCNDNWTVDYIKLLMLRVAQYKAIEWQRSIVYVSFAYQHYIDSAGNMILLQRYTATKNFTVQ